MRHKKIQNLLPSETDVFFQASNTAKPFSARAPLGPRSGSLRRSPRRTMEREQPLPHTLHASTLSVSRSRITSRFLWAPP